MLQTERLEVIYEHLESKNTATIKELSDLLQVSQVTVRKDLLLLERNGKISRTHGGATFVSHSQLYKPVEIRSNLKALQSVATLAAGQINPGDSLFLGSGMTCLLLAKEIKQIENISVVTNNVTALQELIPHVKNVMLIGGELTYHNNMIYSSSERVSRYFEGVYIRKAFTSAIGVDLNAGLTVNNMSSSYIYKSIPAVSSSWYVMCDHTKVGKIGLYQVASLEDVNYLVTDQIDLSTEKAFMKKNVNVLSSGH